MNCLRPQLRAAVGQLISIHTGDHHMFEIHKAQTFRDARGFVQIKRGGAAGFYIAKTTTTRACIAQNHNGGGTSAPTLAHVWTACLLANSVQFMLVHDRL